MAILYNWKGLDKEVVHMNCYEYQFFIHKSSLNGSQFFEVFHEMFSIQEDDRTTEAEEMWRVQKIESTAGIVTVWKNRVGKNIAVNIHGNHADRSDVVGQGIKGKRVYLTETENPQEENDQSIWSYKKLYEYLYCKSLEFYEHKVCMQDEWSMVYEDECTALKLIQEFDKGFEIVNIINRKNEFLYYVEKSDFFQNGCCIEKTKKQQLIVEIKQDSVVGSFASNAKMTVNKKDSDRWQDRVLTEVAKHMLDTKKKAIPLVCNKKLCQVALKRIVAHLDLCWDYIAEEQVIQYFANYHKLILSSDCQALKKFYYKYHRVISMECLTEENYELFLNGDNVASNGNELIIVNSEGWNQTKRKSATINQIYLDLLAETVQNRCEKENIQYKYFSRPIESKVQNVAARWAYHDGKIVFPESILKNGYYQVKDYESRVCHTRNGIRLTTACPADYLNTIWFFGPCIVAGLNVSDEDTMESKLQKLLNARGLKYRVVNCGQHGIGEGKITDINILYKILHTKFRKGDILLQFGSNTWNSGFLQADVPYYDLSEFFNRNEEKCFVNGWTSHLDKRGYEILTDYIDQLIKDDLQQRETQRKMQQQRYYENQCETGVVEKEFYLFNNYMFDENLKTSWNEYYRTLRGKLPDNLSEQKVGCIVMNANPFTYGHAYLIRESLKEVETLIVFVVEEDCSYFSFSERFHMISAYCTRFQNVFVVPSGKCMISTATFGEYFDKDFLQNETVTPVKDAEIFAQVVAPQLHISIRFVGEEPLDLLTRQYNKTLETVLPEYGIAVRKFVRYEVNNQVISASMVRKMIKEEKLAEIEQLVPETTMFYVKRKALQG